jgi:autotransporter-associated beta strand protein
MEFQTKSLVRLLTLSCAAAIVLGSVAGKADTHTWAGNAGSWNLSTNWVENDGGIPDVQDDVANITADIGAAQTISLDAPVTIGSMHVGDSGSSFFGYSIGVAAGNTMTLSHSSGTVMITKNNGLSTDLLRAPLVLASDVEIHNDAPGTGGVVSNNFFQFGTNSTGGSVAGDEAPSTIRQIINNSTTGQFSITGVITGNIALVNNSSGAAMYINSAGANTYTGGTTLNAGSYTTFGNTNATNQNTSAFGTGVLTLNGAVIYNGSTAKTLNNNIVIGTGVSVVRSGSNTRTLTLAGTITGSGTFSTGTSSFLSGPLPVGFNPASSSIRGRTIVQGDISGFTGTFAHETMLTTTNAGNSLEFTGATPASLDGSQAKFAVSGLTSGTTLALQIGSTDAAGTTFKMGELFGMGGMIVQNGTNTTELEVGHLGTSTSFAGVIGGATLGVTKVGGGTLTFTGVNTYAGNTSVETGTLSVTNAYFADAANVLVGGGALLDLNFAGNDVVQALYLNGVPQAPGLYGSSGLGASFFTGSGLLDVQQLGPPITPVPGDFDGNGLVNGDDFAIWQMNFPTASDAMLGDGDADADGDVDGADFVVWQTNFSLAPPTTIVPEPHSWVIVVITVGGLLAIRKRVVR